MSNRLAFFWAMPLLGFLATAPVQAKKKKSLDGLEPAANSLSPQVSAKQAKKLSMILSAALKKKSLSLDARFCGAPAKGSRITSAGITSASIVHNGKKAKISGVTHDEYTLKVMGWCRAQAGKKRTVYAASFQAPGVFWFHTRNKQLVFGKARWEKTGLKVQRKKPQQTAAKKPLGASAKAVELKKPARNPQDKYDALMISAGRSIAWWTQKHQIWLSRLAKTLAQDYAFRRTVSDADERVLPVAAADFAARLGVEELLLVNDQGRVLTHIRRNPSFRGDPYVSGRYQPGQKIPSNMLFVHKALATQQTQGGLTLDRDLGLVIRTVEPVPGPLFTGVLVVSDGMDSEATKKAKAIFGVDLTFSSKTGITGGTLGAKKADAFASAWKKLKKKPANNKPVTLKVGKETVRAVSLAMGKQFQVLVLREL